MSQDNYHVPGVHPRELPGGGPVIGPGHTYASVTEKISSIVLTHKTGKGWILGFGIAFLLTMMMLWSIAVLLAKGIGVWGLNVPVAWAFDITNFVWWIGIGHAGTLISAILLLLRQQWRTSINRFAEAMTLFAVACAGLFPLLHLGRIKWFYYLFPLPNSMALWPQFRSPLMWDVFAISTYLTVSVVFWFIGLIPDLATLRDRATHPVMKVIYGILAMGWRGSALHWRRYSMVYLLLAGLATPLVLSVHSIVSFDFSIAIVPGWHSTIFPPYFVAGALFQGFALVLLLAIPLRATANLRDLITMRHLENCAKMMLVTGLIVFYGYVMEVFFGWYSGNKFESYMTFNNRMFGPFKWSYWMLILCNGLLPQLIWIKKVRTSIPWLFFLSLVVSLGMWLERFVIIATSLAREFVPSMWFVYNPTWVDLSILFGTIGFFVLLFMLFARLLPPISIAEVRELVRHHGHGASIAEEIARTEAGRA